MVGAALVRRMRWTTTLIRATVRPLSTEGSNERATAQATYESYLSGVFAADGGTRDDKAKDALPLVTCPNVVNFDFPHWKCVLSRCDQCPSYKVHQVAAAAAAAAAGAGAWC